MKNKILYLLILILIGFGVYVFLEPYIQEKPEKLETITVKSAGQEIMADGTVESENQAILRFQTSGKLNFLPFKKGDKINQGQLIAALDSYDIQKKLEASLNSYRATRDSFDQAKDNDKNSLTYGSQRFNLETYNKTTLGTGQKIDVLNDMVKRIADQNQATLDNAVINVELAQNAFKLANLYSPISGILTHADTETNFVNITPSTTFIISDPNKIIFKTQVLEQDINFVEIGSSADIKINGQTNKTIPGIVSKISPEKIKNSKGESIYEVDVRSTELQKNYKFGQTGVVFIKSKYKKETTIIPSWLVLDNQFVWIKRNNKVMLQKVTLGNIYNNKTIILDGLNLNDEIITDPKFVIKKFYRNI